MTPETLAALLQGEDLRESVDIKTLVVDRVKKMPLDELEPLLMRMLPELNEAELRKYFYMKRP